MTLCTHKQRVKGAMEVGMSSCENNDVEEERPDVLDDALKDATGWVDLESTNNITKLSIKISISILSNGKYAKIRLQRVNHLNEDIVFMMPKKYSLSLST